MVVVVIIGLLAGAVTFKVVDYLDTAKVNRAKSDLAAIVDAVDTYKLTNDRYPTTNQGLDVLKISTKKDPWGNPYQYLSPAVDDQGNTIDYAVTSYGADGREGGEGIDADIHSYQLGNDGEE
jgi:general secretion pathway protein G